MEELGWIDSKRPRMVTVQSDGCAPIVKAFHAGAEFAETWKNPATVADGLRVPAAVGDFLMLRALRESEGTAVAVSDAEMLAGARVMAKTQGIFAAPESGATVAAFVKLRDGRWIRDHIGRPLREANIPLLQSDQPAQADLAEERPAAPAHPSRRRARSR
jgi:threonine synthase